MPTHTHILSDEAFFATYDPTVYHNPAVAVDVVLVDRYGRVCLKKRQNPPQQGLWGLPGAFAVPGELLVQTCRRGLAKNVPEVDPDLELTQMHTFDGVSRDIRGRVLSVAYVAPVKTLHNDWFDIHQFAPNRNGVAFDHAAMVVYALGYLKRHLYDPFIARRFLEDQFTLTDYRKLVESLLNCGPLNPSNFRKNVELTRGVVRPVKKVSRGQTGLYSFNSDVRDP